MLFRNVKQINNFEDSLYIDQNIIRLSTSEISEELFEMLSALLPEIIGIRHEVYENMLIKLQELKKETSSKITHYSSQLDYENYVEKTYENGNVIDKNGNIIPEYSYLTVLENGYVSDGECVLEGLFAGAGGKLIYNIP